MPSMHSGVTGTVACNPEQLDLELIAAAQRGERGALDAFVRRHDGWVRHIVYATAGHAHELDDIVQHVWARVWEQIGTLADTGRWRGWLYTLARNAAIDAGQKSRRRQEKDREFSVSRSETSEAEPIVALSKKEEHRRVLAAIHGLPAIYREPFMLRHLEDWSYAQIAEALSLPVDTVETRLVRARRLLRSVLTDDKT